MAVPRARISKQRRNKRRSSHWKLALPGLVKCPKCGGELLERVSRKGRKFFGCEKYPE